MKIHIKVILVFFLVSAACSCTKKFDQMNTDPNRLTAVPYSTLITNTEINILRTYNPILTLQASWVRYNVQTVYVHDDRYRITGANTDFNMYPGQFENLKKAMEMAEKAGDKNSMAVIKIMRAYAFQNLTDMYGDIPYSEALKADAPENATIYPKYDSQKDIYMDLILQLKEANMMIDPVAKIGAYDVIFNGDMSKWKRFCNSLLLRIYMRMSIVDAATAKAGIEMIASDPVKYPVISSINNAAFKYWLPSDPNYRSPYYMLPGDAKKQQAATSKFMINFLKDRSDARLPVYAEPAANTGQYVGLALGAEGNANALSIMGVAQFRSANSPTRILRYSEILFIYAEAALNGWNVGMTPKAAYDAAIAASFDEYGIGIGNYLANPLVDFNGGTNHRQLIGDQKWCALYPDANQGWAEVRRSGYPVYVATTEPESSLFPGKGTIKRMPYPYTEAISNPEAFKAAIAAQPGIISEKFGAGVWWDVN